MARSLDLVAGSGPGKKWFEGVHGFRREGFSQLDLAQAVGHVVIGFVGIAQRHERLLELGDGDFLGRRDWNSNN